MPHLLALGHMLLCIYSLSIVVLELTRNDGNRVGSRFGVRWIKFSHFVGWYLHGLIMIKYMVYVAMLSNKSKLGCYKNL